MAQLYDNGLNPALPGYKGNAAPSPAPAPQGTGDNPGGLTYNGVVKSGPKLAQAPVSSSPNVPVSQIMPTQALKLPQPSQDASDADGMAATSKVASKTIEDYIKELTPKETETSKKASALSSQIESLLGQSAGQSEALLKAENQLGLPALQKQLADLNASILTKSAAYDKQWFDQEQRVVPMSSIIGTQAAIRRSQAADIGFLNARAMGLSGQITSAQDTAKRAVELKYAPIMEAIDIKLKQLEVIQPLLDKEEKVQAQALQMKYEDDKAKKLEEKEKAKVNLDMAIEQGVKTRYANRNGEFYDANTGQGFETPEDFFRAAGVTSFAEAYNRNMVTDVSMDKVAARGMVAKLADKYPDAGILPNDTIDTARQKLQGSSMFQKDTYIKPEDTGGYGNYSEDQLKAITKLNDTISKNATYKRTTDMRGFVDTVITSLQQQNGLSDIAAINQFQKIIDEGAVTRDQDVKLIQGAQSLANGLKARISKLQKGEQLTADQRQQMRTLVEQIYDKQVQALSKDPYIKAKGTEAGLYGLTLSDTILGEMGAFGGGEPPPLEQLMIDDPAGVGAAVNSLIGQGISWEVAKETIYEQLGFNQAGNASASTGITKTLAQKFPQGSVGGQCTTFLHKIVDFPPIGDGKNQKFASVDRIGIPKARWQPRVGDVVVTGDNPTYGHTFLVNAVLPGGRVRVTESNFNGNERVTHTRVVSLSDPKIYGAIRKPLKTNLA